ncbi:hypothetical protein JCM10207_005821 [Rhodosporidiobolus poonsookiae]
MSDTYSVGDKDERTSKTSGLSSLFHRAADKLPAVSSLPHLARQQAVHLNPQQLKETVKLQLLIKSLSGVVQDHQALARERQLYSKNLFTWSRDETGGDLFDICDRIAFLEFKQSEFELDAAAKVEQARILLKDIRNFENDLVPRRRNASNVSTKIAALRKDNNKKNEEQIAKLSAELQQLEQENATFEASFDTLKRSKLHEAFSLKFSAQKELAEKSALVAGYGALLLQGMETDGVGADYKGENRTAQVKAELEAALQAWTPSPTPKLSENAGSGFLSRSDSRSFGTTHASQLAQLETSGAAIPSHSHAGPAVPPHTQSQTLQQHQDPFHDAHAASSATSSHPPPLPTRTHMSPTPASPTGPSDFPINLSPVARPASSTHPIGSPPRELPVDLPPPGVDPAGGAGIAPPEPTVAETGAPIAGTGGPASGVLRPRGNSLALEREKEQAKKDKGREETFNAAGWGGGAAPTSGQASMPGAFGFGAASDVGSSSVGHDGERLPGYGEGDDEAARARDRAEEILAQEREAKAAAH